MELAEKDMEVQEETILSLTCCLISTKLQPPTRINGPSGHPEELTLTYLLQTLMQSRRWPVILLA